MLMKTNQKGFGAVEGILILVIVILLGYVGWYVWDANKSADDTLKQSTARQSVNTENKSDTSDDNWKSALPFTVKFPDNWTVKSDGNKSVNYTVNIDAPDTKMEESNFGPVVQSGAQISIYKSRATTYKNIAEFKDGKGVPSQYGANKKDIYVDGREALQYDLGYEGPNVHHVMFFEGGYLYDIAIQQTAYDKAEYAKVYDNLIQSVKFN